MDKLNSAMVERSGLGNTGETFLVGTGGVMLTDSRYPGYSGGDSVLPDAYLQLFSKQQKGRGMYTNYRGQSVIGVFRHLVDTELVLIAEQGQAEAFKPIYTTLRLNLLVALVAVILAVMASAVYTRGLAGRLNRLASTARSISRGELTASAPVAGEREIRALAASFNAMTARLNRRIEIENLVAVVSRELIRILPENTEEVVLDVLERVGGYLDVQRMRVFELEEDGALNMVFEWQLEDVPASDIPIENLTFDMFPWFFDTLNRQGMVHVSRLGDLPPEASNELRHWIAYNIKSLIVKPIRPGGKLRGFLSCEACWGERYWSDDEIGLLELVADSVGNAMERVANLRALHHSEERYALAQQAANIGSWDWDIIKGRVHCSDGFESIMGLKPGQYDNTFRSFLKLSHPDDRQVIIRTIRRNLRDNSDFSLEHRLAAPRDGQTQWIHVAGALYRDTEGRVTRVLGIVRDITLRKRAEEELAGINRELERLVDERTRDLELKAQELLKANEQLRELDQLKSSFLASVSHEFRTPLTSILGFTKLIDKDFSRHFKDCTEGSSAGKGERIKANLGIIYKESERLTRLINDVLDLSKIEAGRVEWRDREISMEACIRSAVDATSMAFAKKPAVSLEIEIAPDLPSLFMDQDRITQVCINLLDNAAKFTEKGRVQLHAGIRGDRLRLTVEDSGLGIEQGELEKVFDSFHQVSRYQSLEDKPEGTGLGLAICLQIVEHYQGRIWAESEIGKGSRFIVELPLEHTAENSLG